MYKKEVQGWAKHLDFMILDIVCLQLAFVLAYCVRHGWKNPYMDWNYRRIAVVLTFLDIIVLVFFESLKNVLKRGYYREFVATFRHVLLIEVSGMVYLFFTHESETYSRTVFFWFPVFYLAISYGIRQIWKEILKRRKLADGKNSLLIVTTEERAVETLENIRKNNYGMYHMAGLVILDRDMQGASLCGVPVVANSENVTAYLCHEWVDEVLITLSRKEHYAEELIDKFIEMGLTVHMELAHSAEYLGKKQIVEHIGRYTVLTTSMNYASIKEVVLKRLLDILGGIAGSLFTGLLCVVLGPMIYIQSPGPIFFAQERVGRNGKKFKMYKFRSMYLDAEEKKAELMAQNRVADGMMFKLDWYPRIIGSKKLPDGTVKKGIGNYIRDWSLDEFPQFFNVLKGDMSLVGTRPPTVDEWEKYELHHRTRLAMKPGITGMWQVSGRSDITDFEEVVKLDRKYISEWSMGLDFRILAKTVAVVLKKDGAM